LLAKELAYEEIAFTIYYIDFVCALDCG